MKLLLYWLALKSELQVGVVQKPWLASQGDDPLSESNFPSI